MLIFTVSENFTLNCDIQKRINFDFIKNILLLLLQHGLDCNVTSQHILKSIMEMVHNVRTCPDILCVYELTQTLIQYGGDPNISLGGTKTNSGNLIGDISGNPGDQIMRAHPSATGLNDPEIVRTTNNDSFRNSFRNSRNYLLFHYIMLITKKEFLLTEASATYVKVIYLFYYSMQHEPLYNCMKSLHNLYIAQVPNKNTDGLIALISQLYKRPRSLKQMCRVVIYESMNKRLALNINRLNLPAPLKEYVLSFEG